jgi:hypothetical protein
MDNLHKPSGSENTTVTTKLMKQFYAFLMEVNEYNYIADTPEHVKM